MQLISVKAAFALGVACFKWVVARVEGHIDTSDALRHIEAAWAASIDPRYANLPQPPPSRTSPPQEFVRPLHLATKMLSDAHAGFTGDIDTIHTRAHGFVRLVDHIAGRHPAFDPWLAESLHVATSIGRRPRDRSGGTMPRELFEPSFVWSEDAVQEALRRVVQTLDPAANPYLRSAEEMLADGFEGQPYGGST